MLQLPPEVIFAIARTLDFRSILALASTCHQLRDAYEAYQELQHIVDLGADGLLPATSSNTLSLDERRALLLARRSAWKALRPMHKTSFEYPNLWDAFDLAGGVLARYARGEALVLHWLPTRTAPERVVEVEIQEAAFALHKLALDPAQDLLVFLELTESPEFGNDPEEDYGTVGMIQVHLRTLSSYGSAQHKRAIRPILQYNCDSLDMDFAELFLAGDSIAVFLNHHDRPELCIWDWSSGASLLRLHPPDFVAAKLLADTITFSFLSPHAFVLAGADLTGTIPALHLVRLDRTLSPLRTLDSAVVLQLPALSANRSIEQVTAHSSSFSEPEPPRLIHFPDPAVCISTFVVQVVGNVVVPDVAIMFVVHTKTLLAYLAGRAPTNIAWAEWGPGRTRIIEHGENDGLSDRPVLGSRVAFSTQYGEPPQVHLLLDFNVDFSGTKSKVIKSIDPATLADLQADFTRDHAATALGHHSSEGQYEWTNEQVPEEQLPFRCAWLSVAAFDDSDEVLLGHDHLLRQRAVDALGDDTGPGEMTVYAF